MHSKLPTLYQSEALLIVQKFDEALRKGQLNTLTYLQVNGVRLELPDTVEGYIIVSQEDFEKILEIFQGDTYGVRLREQRELGIPNSSYYQGLLEEAVNAFFPDFP